MRFAAIPSTLFSDRRKQFAARMTPNAVAIFHSHDLMPRNGDQHFPFRQDSILFALSGLTQEETILILHPGAAEEKAREILFILPRDQQKELWQGERLTAHAARVISGISTIRTTTHWGKVMYPILQSCSTIYLNAGMDTSASSIPSRNDRIGREILKEYQHHQFAQAQTILRQMMMIKHPLERELMKKAIAVTAQAFDRVLHVIRPGLKEYEVEAELTYTLVRHGCQHAFEPIVASGASACTLHYTRNNRVIRKGDLVLLDFGAEYACMASDMSRTLPASGRFTPRQRDLYSSVLHILNSITEMMRPGITLEQLNQETSKLLEAELIRLRILTRSDIRRQDPRHPLHRKYFMHGISHHLGYDVHDLCDRAAPLKAGMILTCEPGLYIPEEKTGIRLENDILITRGKPVNLMQHIPIDPDHIEDIMSTGV